MLELLGYLASLLVAISLMMSSIVKLRIINLVGAACFTLYGFFIHAYPVMCMNLFVVLIDAYYLAEMFTKKEYFTILETSESSEYFKRFVTFYEKDIAHFLPDFALTPTNRRVMFFVLRNLVPAGVFVGQEREDGALQVTLDFVIPGYRDYKIGEFIFSKAAAVFKEKGFHALYSPPGHPAHEKYLRRMGFAPAGNQAEYVKML